MPTLSSYNQYRRTDNATAVAADIKSGKTAFGPDGKIVGAQTIPGLVLYWDFRGAAGAYTPALSDAQYAYAGMSMSPSGTWEFDASNFLYPATLPAALSFASVPVYDNIRARQYLLSFYGDDGTPGGTVDININSGDGGNVLFVRLANTTGQWIMQLYTVTNSVTTLRETFAFNTAVENCLVNVLVSDFGDMVVASATLWEYDTTSVISTGDVQWYELNRANKSNTAFIIDVEVAASVGLKNLIVMEL